MKIFSSAEWGDVVYPPAGSILLALSPYFRIKKLNFCPPRLERRGWGTFFFPYLIPEESREQLWMVGGLECAASLLSSSREYTTVEITSTISCWKDWLGFPFHSALVTQIATISAVWTLRDRNRQMFSSTPLPPQEFGAQKVFGGEEEETNKK